MSIADNLKLVSYAAAADAFDKSKDIFMGFLPMIESLLVLPAEKYSVSFLGLQNTINATYQVDIPKSTLRYLLDMLEQQGKLRVIDGKTIVPTKAKIDEAFECFEVNRTSIDAFFFTFQNYLAEKNETATFAEISEHICKWIYAHSNDLARFISSGSVNPQLSSSAEVDEWQNAAAFLHFLIECRTSRTSSYEAFLRLFDGAVQASLLNFQPEEIKDLSNQNALLGSVILDTNCVLRLLGLQAPLDNETTIATWKTLSDCGVKIYALDQTIVEASQSIKNFLSDISPYSQRVSRYLPKVKIHASGFLAAINNGVTRTQLLEYSKEEKIREILSNTYSVSFVDDYTETIPEDVKNELIEAKCSEGYGSSQATHDLLLIYYCRKKRPRRINSFTNAQWWVLTNDKKLTYWNQTTAKVFQECITEVQFSNLMWLQSKKSNRDGLTNTVMALAAKTSTSARELSEFAVNIEAYCSANAEKADLLDKVSLVFAGSAITDEDIKKINANTDDVSALIEKKAEEVIAHQLEQKSEHDATCSANAELNLENKELKEKLERRKLESRKTILLRDIADSENVIKQSEKRQKEIADLQAFCDAKHKPVGRWLAIIIILLLAISVTIVCHYFYKPIVNWLSEEIEKSSVLWNIVSIGVLGFAVTLIYYLLIAVFCGSILTPKELFDAIREKWVMSIRRNYVLNNRLSTEFATGELSILLSQETQTSAEENRKLSRFRDELRAIEDALI